MTYKKYFTLSFDDGVEHDKKIISLMNEYGLKGTFNLNGGLLGQKPWYTKISRIPKDEIRQVYAGNEIASHGYKHEYYPYKTAKSVFQSIEEDVKALSEVAGYPVVGHAFPFDGYTKSAEEALKKLGLSYGRKALGKGSFSFPDNPLKYQATAWFNAKNIFALMDEFINATPVHDDMLFMMWGHSYELEYGLRRCPIEQLKKIFHRISGHPDIIYCTNKEAFAKIGKDT